MKIAYIGQKGIPAQQGGVEKHVQELATRLVKFGHQVTVYSRFHYTGSRRGHYRGVNLINLPSLNTKHFDAISHTALASWHAIWQGYDVIHYHGVGPALLAWLPRLFSPKTTVIVTFHCIDRQHQKWGVFARLMLAIGEWATCHFPHQTIVVSHTLQKYCQYRFDRPTTYIPNGVAASRSVATKTTPLKRFNLTTGNYILAVSRLVQHKGLATLIAAFKQTATTKKLVIVGSGINGSGYEKELRQLAATDPRIIFTGQQTGATLEQLFRQAYLFVQPSEAEGLSIALLEAMAYGVPTLISDIEENQEAIAGQGWEFKNRNVHDLTRQLTFTLKHPQQLKTAARRAKRHVRRQHNWDQIALATTTVYQEVTTRHNLYKHLPVTSR